MSTSSPLAVGRLPQKLTKHSQVRFELAWKACDPVCAVDPSTFLHKKANEDEEPLRYRPVADARILQPFPVSFGRDCQK